MSQTEDWLYAGSDLDVAAERSSRVNGLGRARGWRNAVTRLIKSNKSAPGAPLIRELARVRTPDHENPLTVTYVGRGENRTWLLEKLFDLTEAEHRPCADTDQLTSDDFAGSDLIFVDDATLARDARLVQTPSWVKQRVAVAPEWAQQLERMPRDRRREVSRVLRRQGYTARVSRTPEAALRFYDELYRPYVTARHGASAVIVAREDFVRECRSGGIVELHRSDTLVGASLLRPIANSLSVVWTGLRLDDDGSIPTGAADALDYYSLLIAKLQRFRWLDLGPSRASLNDGTFRYKARWNARVHRGYVASATIGWRVNRAHPALPDALGAIALLNRAPGGLGCRLVMRGDGNTPPDAQKLRAKWQRAGINAPEFIWFSGDRADAPPGFLAAGSPEELVRLLDPQLR